MGAVSKLPDFKEGWATAPTLVLVDIHDDHPSQGDRGGLDYRAALEKCAAALAHARLRNLPVAFVRHMPPSPSLLASRTYPSWIGEIRPRRSDMIFERAPPSCYASLDFAQMAARSGGLILAGLFGETACLSTLVDGHARGHAFTFLGDASVSHGLHGIPADALHRSVVAIASLYAEVSATAAWVNKTSGKLRTGG